MRTEARQTVPSPPPTPGEVLRDCLSKAPGVTQDKLAAAMNVSRFSVNQIVNGRRAITAEMAMRLGRVTGTSAVFWMNLQRGRDLFEAEETLASEIERLPVLIEPVREDEFMERDRKSARVSKAVAGAKR